MRSSTGISSDHPFDSCTGGLDLDSASFLSFFLGSTFFLFSSFLFFDTCSSSLFLLVFTKTETTLLWIFQHSIKLSHRCSFGLLSHTILPGECLLKWVVTNIQTVYQSQHTSTSGKCTLNLEKFRARTVACNSRKRQQSQRRSSTSKSPCRFLRPKSPTRITCLCPGDYPQHLINNNYINWG